MGLEIALPSVGVSDERCYLDILDGEETWLQRRLVRRGLAKYEPETMATLLALAHTGPDNGAFIDVGAHFGFYASVMERLAGKQLTQIHALEPTPATYTTGCRIREANGLSFAYHRLALSNEKGEASLYLSSTAEVTNSLMAGFRRARGTVSVETMRLDDFVREFGVAPSLLKIDVECYEVPVLEGGLGAIEQNKPSLVVEVLERHHESFLSTPVWQRLSSIGYRYYHIHPAVPWRANRRNTLYPRSRDLLLVPKELDIEFWLQYMTWRYALSRCTHRLHRKTSSATMST